MFQHSDRVLFVNIGKTCTQVIRIQAYAVVETGELLVLVQILCILQKDVKTY